MKFEPMKFDYYDWFWIETVWWLSCWFWNWAELRLIFERLNCVDMMLGESLESVSEDAANLNLFLNGMKAMIRFIKKIYIFLIWPLFQIIWSSLESYFRDLQLLCWWQVQILMILEVNWHLKVRKKIFETFCFSLWKCIRKSALGLPTSGALPTLARTQHSRVVQWEVNRPNIDFTECWLQ